MLNILSKKLVSLKTIMISYSAMDPFCKNTDYTGYLKTNRFISRTPAMSYMQIILIYQPSTFHSVTKSVSFPFCEFLSLSTGLFFAVGRLRSGLTLATAVPLI
jgi:hypothetical protein